MRMSKSMRFDKSKSKCLICQKLDHFKKDCLERGYNEYSVQIVITFDDDSYESVDVLVKSSLETQ